MSYQPLPTQAEYAAPGLYAPPGAYPYGAPPQPAYGGVVPTAPPETSFAPPPIMIPALPPPSIAAAASAVRAAKIAFFRVALLGLAGLISCVISLADYWFSSNDGTLSDVSLYSADVCLLPNTACSEVAIGSLNGPLGARARITVILLVLTCVFLVAAVGAASRVSRFFTPATLAVIASSGAGLLDARSALMLRRTHRSMGFLAGTACVLATAGTGLFANAAMVITSNANTSVDWHVGFIAAVFTIAETAAMVVATGVARKRAAGALAAVSLGMPIPW